MLEPPRWLSLSWSRAHATEATLRILFLSPRYPYPPTRGDQVRVFHLVEGLARHARIKLLSFGSGPPLPVEGVDVQTVARSAGDLLRANLRARDAALPLQVRLFLTESMRRAVREELGRTSYDVVHATLVRMAPYLPAPGTGHRHLDLVDALSVNMTSRAERSPPIVRSAIAAEARLLRSYERRWSQAVESCSLVSAVDRGMVAGLEHAAIVPNGVDLRMFTFAEPSSRPPVLLFFGNLGYFHNIAPATFVAREVLPLVRERVPEASLRLAGARPAGAVQELARLEGVEVIGAVDSMATELHGAAVAVLPSFSGSGMKNTILESFAAGTPVVTHPAGIQGVSGVRAGAHYLSATSAAQFASACVALLTSPTERCSIAHRAVRVVVERYTWRAAVEALLELYSGRRPS